MFLRWPLQSFFIEIANQALGALSKKDYRSLLIDIINKMNDGRRDWNYKKLFIELWQKSPNALKSIITYEFDLDGCQNSIVTRIKDKEILRLILKDVTVAENKLIFNVVA